MSFLRKSNEKIDTFIDKPGVQLPSGKELSRPALLRAAKAAAALAAGTAVAFSPVGQDFIHDGFQSITKLVTDPGNISQKLYDNCVEEDAALNTDPKDPGPGEYAYVYPTDPTCGIFLGGQVAK